MERQRLRGGEERDRDLGEGAERRAQTFGVADRRVAESPKQKVGAVTQREHREPTPRSTQAGASPLGRPGEDAGRAGRDEHATEVRRLEAATKPTTARVKGALVSRGLSPRAMALIALAVAVIPAVSAYVVSSRQETRYGARAEFVFQSPDVSQRQIDTQRAVLSSRTVLAPAAAAAGLPVAALEENVTVEVDGESNVLELTVEDADEERALAVAQGISDAYLADLSIDSTIDRAETLVKAQIDDLSERLTRVRSQAEALPGTTSPEEAQLQSEAVILLERLGRLQESLTDLELRRATEGNAVTVVAAPHLLEDPVAPRPYRAAAFGAITGVFLAAAVVLVLVRVRSRRGEPV